MSWTPIRYAHNGDVSIAYRVAGGGPVDLLFIGGFVSHLEIGVEPPLAERLGADGVVRAGDCVRQARDGAV